MIYAAIRHEPTRRYCYCIAPGRFRFCLQTAKDDMRHVWLFSRDKYMPLHQKDTRRVLPMKKVACDGIRDYYEVEMDLDVVCLRYCFELEDMAGIRVYFSHSGFTREVARHHGEVHPDEEWKERIAVFVADAIRSALTDNG